MPNPAHQPFVRTAVSSAALLALVAASAAAATGPGSGPGAGPASASASASQTEIASQAGVPPASVLPPRAVAASSARALPPVKKPVCRAFERRGSENDVAVPAAADGTVWYADRLGNRLVRIAPDGAQTSFVPGEGATRGLSGLAPGPDGRIWYTKDVANRVGFVSPADAATREYTLPEPNSLPGQLVADRSGRLWFVSSIRKFVGEVRPDGSIVVHRDPSLRLRGFEPNRMTLGPDGNLWITDREHNAIHRYDVRSGAFARFDVPTAEAQPHAITAGADGNVWFTLLAAAKIGRISPDGAITEFALGDLRGGGPRGIVGTPDGSLWVTTSVNVVVRFRADGTRESFPCGRDLGTAIVGPHGAPWFFDHRRIRVVEEAKPVRTPE